MQGKELLYEIERLIERYGTGLLATVDSDGTPGLRWMSPFFMRDRPGSIFALTVEDSKKVDQINAHPKVRWLFQPPTLDKMYTLSGEAKVIHNYSMQAEAMELMGGRLKTFWTVHREPKELCIVETTLWEGERIEVFKGVRVSVSFKEEQ